MKFCCRAAENMDVFPDGSVAVAVMYWSRGTRTGDVKVKLALPEASDVTWSGARNCWPSPLPDGSSGWSAKNSRRKVVLA